MSSILESRGKTILEKYFYIIKKENVIYQNAESGSGSKKRKPPGQVI